MVSMAYIQILKNIAMKIWAPILHNKAKTFLTDPTWTKMRTYDSLNLPKISEKTRHTHIYYRMS